MRMRVRISEEDWTIVEKELEEGRVREMETRKDGRREG